MTTLMDRRTFLRSTGAGGAVLLSGAAGAPWAAATRCRTRVYVLVIDGCRPDEITSTLTPRLHALRRRGRWFPNARSLPVMETIPNHVMMLTGVRPNRSGVPANLVYDRAEDVVRFLDRPADLGFPTLLERLRRRGLTTGSVLSKEYLYGIFGTRATYRWEPKPLIPVSDHAPDAFTVDALIAMAKEADPHFIVANLGDIDRAGHSDVTGTTLELWRTAALADTDVQVGRFVDFLRDSGRWDRSVLVVLADHSMDWSNPDRVVSLTPAIEADPTLAGRVHVAENGGADLLYWTGRAARRDEALTRLRDVVTDVRGVLRVHAPSRLRLGPEAGDLVAYCRAGWRFTEPTPVSNPIPGNHGHPATKPIPFFLSGGSPLVRRGVSPTRVTTLDVAPTVGSVFDLPRPRGGYDGSSRL